MLGLGWYLACCAFVVRGLGVGLGFVWVGGLGRIAFVFIGCVWLGFGLGEWFGQKNISVCVSCLWAIALTTI